MRYTTHLLRHLRAIIGEHIRSQRMAQGLTLTEIAQRSGLSEQRLMQFEEGRNTMDVAQLCKIACALQVEIKVLLA